MSAREKAADGRGQADHAADMAQRRGSVEAAEQRIVESRLTNPGHTFPLTNLAETVSRNQSSNWDARNPPLRETTSRFERSFWDAFSQSRPKGKVRPTLRPDFGTQFPKADPKGKYIPFRALILGRSFPLRHLWESASHFKLRSPDTLPHRHNSKRGRRDVARRPLSHK